MKLEYSFSATPFGEIIAIGTGNRICALEFTCGIETKGKTTRTRSWESALAELSSIFSATYPDCEIIASGALAERAATHLLTCAEPFPSSELMLHGTPFQLEVWQALCKVERGTTISYSELAAMVGRPTAIRAAASAVALNPVSLLIPCHRIVPSNGSVGKFRWGSECKAAILEWERQIGK